MSILCSDHPAALEHGSDFCDMRCYAKAMREITHDELVMERRNKPRLQA